MASSKGFIQTKFWKVVAITFIVLLCTSQVISIQQKAFLMKENGRRACSLLVQIIPYVHKVPANGILVLLNPENTNPEYSVLLMNDFDVLKYGTNIINSLSGRKDIHIWIVNEHEREKLPIPSGSLFLTLVGNDVQLMHSIGSN